MRVVRAGMLDLGAAPSRNASTSITSARPVSAPPGRPPATTFASAVRSGVHADHRLRTARRPAEARHDLVEHDERAVRARGRRDRGDALGRERHGAPGGAGRLEDHAGHVAALELALQRARRRTGRRRRDRVRRRARRGAPRSTGSATPGHRVVVPAVEVAGQLEHAVAAGEAARDAQREQRRLGAARGEAHALGARHERDDALGPVRLRARCSRRGAGPAPPGGARPRRRPDASGRRRARRAPMT